MPILRLAYTTQFLLALIAVFFVWSEIGGQSHLDLMPWWWKVGLGGGAAFSCVQATMAAVSGEAAWNGRTLRWFGVTLMLLAACGAASWYVHTYGEDDEDQGDETKPSVARVNDGWWRVGVYRLGRLGGGFAIVS